MVFIGSPFGIAQRVMVARASSKTVAPAARSNVVATIAPPTLVAPKVEAPARAPAAIVPTLVAPALTSSPRAATFAPSPVGRRTGFGGGGGQASPPPAELVPAGPSAVVPAETIIPMWAPDVEAPPAAASGGAVLDRAVTRDAPPMVVVEEEPNPSRLPLIVGSVAVAVAALGAVLYFRGRV